MAAMARARADAPIASLSGHLDRPHRAGTFSWREEAHDKEGPKPRRMFK